MTYPSRCIEEACSDKFPETPSEALVQAYRKYTNLAKIKRKKVDQRNAFILALYSVCIAIKRNDEDLAVRIRAEELGWPLETNFAQLPERIEKHKDEILALLNNEIVLSASMPWSTFIQALDKSTFTFHSIKGTSWTNKSIMFDPECHAG